MSVDNAAAGASGREEKNTGNIRREGTSRSQSSGENTDARRSNADGGGANTTPEWANGLRQLYDSVIEEPLPDSFNDLLAQLNDDGK